MEERLEKRAGGGRAEEQWSSETTQLWRSDARVQAECSVSPAAGAGCKRSADGRPTEETAVSPSDFSARSLVTDSASTVWRPSSWPVVGIFWCLPSTSSADHCPPVPSRADTRRPAVVRLLQTATARMTQAASYPAAAVTSECVQSFFNHLDSAHLSRVRLRDLHSFTERHRVTFSLTPSELAACTAPGRMPPSTEEQHARIVGEMFAEALSLRAPTMYCKDTQQATGVGEPTLALADLTAVLRVRSSLVQSPRGSTQFAVPQTQFREQWIQLLLCVEPNPFDPSSRDSAASARGQKDGYLSFRAHTDRTNLPQSMYEREAAHAAKVRRDRARRRKNAPGSGPYHPSITLPSAPPARSAGSCYDFSQPVVRSVQLSAEYLADRAAKEEAARAQEEREWNPRVRQQKMLERTLQAHAHAFERTQAATTDATPQPSVSSSGDAREADVNSPSFYRDDDEDESSGGPLASGEQLDAPALQRITFRTQDAWKGRTEALKDKSDALEFKQDASAAALAEEEEGQEDLLAKALFASMAGSSQTLSPKKPEGTTAERVAKALAAQRVSYATSGKFKAPAAATADQATGSSAGAVRLPDGSLRPRWLNADAPMGASGSQSSRAAPGPPAVQFDDQGRPIRVHTRRAFTERLIAPQGRVSLTEERRANDGEQAFQLAVNTERYLQELPLPDPLDALLAPFVVPSALPNPVRALERALEITPSTAANSSRRSAAAAAAALSTAASIPGAAVTARPGSAQSVRPRSAKSARGSAAGPQTARASTAADPAASYASSTARSAASPSESSRRPPFLLDFPRRSPQDERRMASRSLTCFGSASDGGGADAPTIANGGITKLAQLRRGYAPSLQAQLHGQLDRDASLGDLSLLRRGSAELSMLLARQKLDASRPPFRLDFKDKSERGLDANVITRDGGATTAAELEAWRLAQLGFPLRAGLELSTARHALRLNHTHGVVVHTDHLAPGSHRAKHPAPFSALLGVGEHDSPLDKNRVAGLAASEREAIRHEKHMLAAPVSAAAARRAAAATSVDSSPQSLDALRASLAQKMRPSEKRKVDEAAKQADARQQFPFGKINYEEAKSQN